MMGEKFGLWPETYAHVYEAEWLEKFLTVLESNKDWIVTSRISDYLTSHIPHGRVYLPTASYSEMAEWTLPAPAQEALGIFQNPSPARRPGRGQTVCSRRVLAELPHQVRGSQYRPQENAACFRKSTPRHGQ